MGSLTSSKEGLYREDGEDDSLEDDSPEATLKSELERAKLNRQNAFREAGEAGEDGEAGKANDPTSDEIAGALTKDQSDKNDEKLASTKKEIDKAQEQLGNDIGTL